ncbi:hypothetical protein Tco_0379613 [Tanacetum coccineum]
MRILSVVSVHVKKKFGYGYLKEIVVKRADQQLYKFKGGDFPYLHPNNIEDMLLLLTQNKLFNLDGDVIVDLGTLLHGLKNFRLEYNRNSNMPRREWTEKDPKRTGYVLRKIDGQLLKRRIMRSIEVLVGGRNTETDKRLLQRTV